MGPLDDDELILQQLFAERRRAQARWHNANPEEPERYTLFQMISAVDSHIMAVRSRIFNAKMIKEQERTKKSRASQSPEETPELG